MEEYSLVSLENMKTESVQEEISLNLDGPENRGDHNLTSFFGYTNTHKESKDDISDFNSSCDESLRAFSDEEVETF